MSSGERLDLVGRWLGWTVNVCAGGIGVWYGYAFGARLAGVGLGVFLALVCGAFCAILADAAVDWIVGRRTRDDQG